MKAQGKPFLRLLWAAVFFVLVQCLNSLASAQDTGWARGNIVGLRAGTCIREGPGFGYRAHTRVPEDNWAVMVIDGPRQADGRIWWDTSRRAAGDPSGGTGWVTQDQTDTDCALPEQGSSQLGPFSSPSVPISTAGSVQQFLEWLQRQSPFVKLAIAVAALLLLRTIWGSLANLLIGLIGAVISAILIYLVMDLTRFIWQGPWTQLATAVFGAGAPDLALVLALLPLASWLLWVLRTLLKR